MIVASLLSRYAFVHSVAASSSAIVLNAPQSSPATQDDFDLQRSLSSSSSSLVRRSTADCLQKDPTLAGGILRLAFHDAATVECDRGGTYTGGPNGSIKYEVGWSENRGISRPLSVLEDIHDSVGERVGLSLADCIALAGAESVAFAGGPRIPIKLGRVDTMKSDARKRRKALRQSTDRSLVETTLPSAGLDSDGLRLYFGALGFTESELVALCGAHDLGRHVTLLDMDKGCLKNLTRDCLENAPTLMPFVTDEPDKLSNTYFKKLLLWNEQKITLGEVAFIPTDVDLVVDEGLRVYVQDFARDEQLFFSTFKTAYQKLVDIGLDGDDIY